jgi:uncharacterized protein (TIGR02145 family)
MKKTLTLLLGMILLYSCSTTSDGNTAITSVVHAPPENLTGEAISTTAIDLMWTDLSTNETGFKIERKLVGGTFEEVGTTATDIATFRDKGLALNTIYIYRVYSYNEGGESPVYSNELTRTTNLTITSIVIGSQTWTAKNLDVATYSDGTPIPEVTDPTAWKNLATGAWCYYNNDPANGTTYGKLYNWYAVAGIWNEASKTDASQRKKLAPTGYHVPSNVEWTTLTNTLDLIVPVGKVGGKMKSTGTSLWASPNTSATNSSGFAGLPGGCRYLHGTTFYDIGLNGYWWSSSENVTTNAWFRYLNFNNDTATSFDYNKAYGLSVRCLKD